MQVRGPDTILLYFHDLWSVDRAAQCWDTIDENMKHTKIDLYSIAGASMYVSARYHLQDSTAAKRELSVKKKINISSTQFNIERTRSAPET